MSVTMTVDYQGQLHCALSHQPSSARIETDAPKDNEGRGEAFSPTDLVGAALASCAITTMAIKAPKEGIQFSRARGKVVKEMTTEPPRKIARLSLEIELPTSLSLEHRARLEAIARSCPVALSLNAAVELPMRFIYTD
ncbi:MAG: OsmC family protein [Deltaproteobacteria bacterium]|nr:OsmC family protein [Deltaproteobacteria bacterium]